jgi:hypothetical protein
MGNTNHSNRGNEEWQRLSERHGNPAPMRSRASSVFEAELRRMLNSYTTGDISGLWVDWKIPSKEPLWIPAPGESDDAS